MKNYRGRNHAHKSSSAVSDVQQKIEKFTEKIMNEDTVELTDEMVEKAMEAFQFLTKEDLVKKYLPLNLTSCIKSRTG